MDEIKPVGYVYSELLPDGGKLAHGALTGVGLKNGDPLYSQAAIDTLRAEVEQANERAEYWRVAKASDFYRDAMRYRWLVESGKFVPSIGPVQGWGLGIGARDPSTKEELDAAIDAAMQGGA